MSDVGFACVLALAWFAAVNLAASAIVAAVASRLERRDARRRSTTSPAGLLGLKLLPGLASGFFTFAVFVPAQWRFEPEGVEEQAGVCLILLALGGLVTVALAGRRAARDTVVTRRLERGWMARATRRGDVEREDLPAYCLPDAAPILSLVGIWKPRLFVTQPVIDAFTPEELEVSVAHELAHRDTRDNLKRLLVSYSPDMLWLWRSGRQIERRWRAAVEFAADARAVAGSEERAVSLASALLKVVRLGPASAATAGIGLYDGTLLWARIDRLLAPPERGAAAAGLPRAWSVCLGGVGVCTAVLAAEGVWLTVHAVTEGLIRFLP